MTILRNITRRAFTLAGIAAVAGMMSLGSGKPVFAQEGSHLQSILSNGVLRVGTTGDFVPMTVRDVASGSYKGFEIDAANQLAADLGVSVEFVPTDWKTLVSGVLADKFDIAMTGSSINPGRAKTVGFTQPYFFVGTVPMTLESNADKFTSWADANKEGVTIAVTLGTVFDEQAQAAFPNATIVKVEAPATGYQEVLSGRADVTITSNVDAASLMERYSNMVTFATGDVRNQRPLGYMTTQNDFVFINYVNTWIDMKNADGFFNRNAQKWGLE